MTTTATDPWIERHIAAGRLAPGARGMARDDAAHQYNEANALTIADDDFLYTPEQAQKIVHDVLRFVDTDVPDHHEVSLTDLAAGPRAGGYAVNTGQIEAATEQYRLVTGESICSEALIAALPWA